MSNGNGLAPIVIVGAARSGTKAFRDAFSMASGIPAVPYDVGYVWRYGSDSPPDDRQIAAQTQPKTERMVHQFLSRYADADGRVIEKTVGTTLRVGYVAKLVPNAIFVHLVRDGVDVAESARRQWLAPADYGYLRRKLRHFPPRLLATYGRQYATRVLLQRFSDDHAAPSWGPRYPGIDDDVAHEDLLTVCARQWRASVTTAQNDFDSHQIEHIDLRYEALVTNPEYELGRVIKQVGIHVDPYSLAAASATLHPGHGNAIERLSDPELLILDSELGDTLDQLGYDRPTNRKER